MYVKKFTNETIVSRGDRLGNQANIKVENTYGAVGDVGISLTVGNPLVFCSQILTELINAMFLLVINFKMIGMLLNVLHGQVQKIELTKTYNKVFPNHSL